MSAKFDFGGVPVPERASGVPADWLLGIPREQQADFAKYIHSCGPLLEQLSKILHNKLETSRTQKRDDYSSPGWPYARAALDGFELALREIDQLTQLAS